MNPPLKPLSNTAKKTVRRHDKFSKAVDAYADNPTVHNLYELAWTWNELGEQGAKGDAVALANEAITKEMVEKVYELPISDVIQYPCSFLAFISRKKPALLAKLGDSRQDKIILFMQGSLAVIFQGPDWFFTHPNLTDAIDCLFTNWDNPFDYGEADAGYAPEAFDRDHLRNAICEAYTKEGLEGVKKIVGFQK